jgi:hypothetical protein
LVKALCPFGSARILGDDRDMGRVADRDIAEAKALAS